MLRGKRLGPYYLEKLLGKGTFGEVYRAFDSRNREHVAIKLLRDTKKGQKEYEYEIAAHEFLSETPHCHKYVMCLLDAGYYNSHGTFRNRIRSKIINVVPGQHYYLVTELMDGNLNDLKNTRYLRWTYDHPSHVAYLIFGLIKGVQYIHQQGLAHKDIKPENIMYRIQTPKGTLITWRECLKDPTFVVRFFQIKYGDLGLSCTSAGLETRADKNLPRPVLRTCSSNQGTPAYLSPEIIYQIAHHIPFSTLAEDQASDMWALGMTLWTIFYGKPPKYLENILSLDQFADKMLGMEQEEIDNLILENPIPIVDEDLREAVVDILLGLMTLDPFERINSQQALKIISDFI